MPPMTCHTLKRDGAVPVVTVTSGKTGCPSGVTMTSFSIMAPPNRFCFSTTICGDSIPESRPSKGMAKASNMLDNKKKRLKRRRLLLRNSRLYTNQRRAMVAAIGSR